MPKGSYRGYRGSHARRAIDGEDKVERAGTSHERVRSVNANRARAWELRGDRATRFVLRVVAGAHEKANSTAAGVAFAKAIASIPRIDDVAYRELRGGRAGEEQCYYEVDGLHVSRNMRADGCRATAYHGVGCRVTKE